MAARIGERATWRISEGWAAAGGVCLRRQCARRAEIAACLWVVEASVGAAVCVVTDCVAVRNGVAALRHGARWPLDGVDGDLWERLRVALARVRWEPAHLARGKAMALGVIPPDWDGNVLRCVLANSTNWGAQPCM